MSFLKLEKDEKKSVEKERSGEREKVEKFLGLEKSIATKRENPFSSVADGAGPSKKKKGDDEMSIINTSTITFLVFFLCWFFILWYATDVQLWLSLL